MEFFKTTKGKITAVFIAVLCIAAVIAGIVIGTRDKNSYRTISVSELYGDVRAENNGKVYDAYPEMNLSDGYALFTGADSYTRMVLDSDKYIKLEELSRAVFEKLGKTGDNYTAIRLENGVITNEIAKPLPKGAEYTVNTPNAAMAVRGTFFRVKTVKDENGDYYTDIFTYGGSVECKRILPDGTVVNETVMVEAGFKTRIKMDSSDTIYLVEMFDDNGTLINTTPIVVSEDISDEDLIDMFDAAKNGHEMFLSIEEIEALIIERGIDIEKYRSKYDGSQLKLTGSYTTTSVSSADTTAAATTTEITTIASSAETTTPPSSVESEQSTVLQSSEYVSEATTKAARTTTKTEVTVRKTEKTTSETEETVKRTEKTTKKTEKTTKKTEKTTKKTDKTTKKTEAPVDESVPGNTTVSTAEITITTVAVTSSVPSFTVPVTITVETSETTSAAVVTETITTEHECVFENYVYNNDATCSEDGTMTGLCSCGKTDTITAEGTKTAHTEVTESKDATFYENGYIRVYCGACDEEISYEVIEKLSPLNLSQGDIVISSTGYSQSGGEEVGFTGDYLFAQESASSGGTITIQSGTHNIAFENVTLSVSDMDGFIVESGAKAVLSGNLTVTAASSDSGSYALNNSGSIEFASGTFSFEAGEGAASVYNAGSIQLTDGTLNTTGDFMNTGGVLTVNGGALAVDGMFNNISDAEFTMNGGSFSSDDYFGNDGNSTTEINDGSFKVVVQEGPYCVYVNSGSFTVNGGICEVSSSGYGLYSRGNVYINGGRITASGNYSSLTADTGKFEISGGSIVCKTAVSAYIDIVMTGGSLRIINGAVEGYKKITNGEAEVSCVCYDVLPAAAELVFTKSDDTSYAYGITEADTADDGKYYLWLPVATVDSFSATESPVFSEVSDADYDGSTGTLGDFTDDTI